MSRTEVTPAWWWLDGMSVHAHAGEAWTGTALCGAALTPMTQEPTGVPARLGDTTPLPNGQKRCPGCAKALVAPRCVETDGARLWASQEFFTEHGMTVVWPPLAAVVGATRFAGVTLEHYSSLQGRWVRAGRMGRIEATLMVRAMAGASFRLVWDRRKG